MSTITTKTAPRSSTRTGARRRAADRVPSRLAAELATTGTPRCSSSSAKGYRVVAHDRRGHGRSSQVSDGHDMDHYAADAAAVVEHLDLRERRPHRPLDRRRRGGPLRRPPRQGPRRQAGAHRRRAADHGEDAGQSRAACRSRCSTASAQQLAANRAQFYLDVASGPFYGYNRPGAKVSQGVIDNWWRQGMMGGAKAHYDGIKAFSETDFTEDLKIDRRADAGHARRRRPDRADRRLRAAVGEAPEEGHAEGLREVPARHVHDARRRDQRRPARLHQGLSADRWKRVPTTRRDRQSALRRTACRAW